ncbi:MAG TPA: GntR family transcriptional regulator, partial [Pseudonocardia sp.]
MRQQINPGAPSVEMSLDRDSPVPLYFQVASQLQRLIEDGTLAIGDRLQNEVELADQLGVSRPTIRQAIGYLVDRGLVTRKRGVGTEIIRPKVRRPVRLTSLYDDLAEAGRRPRTTVRRLETRPAPEEIAQALGISVGSPIHWVERLRYADDEPLALMHNAVPAEVIRLTTADLTDQGLNELLRAAGRAPRSADQSVGAKVADNDEAALLDEPLGAALLTVTRTTLDVQDQPIEYGAHVYR